MKNILYCLIVILAVLLLIVFIWIPPYGQSPSDTVPTGSTEETTLPTTPATEGSTAPTQPITVPGYVWAESDMAAISMPLNTDSVPANDGTVIFQHSYQDIALRTNNAEVTRAITLDLLKRIDSGNNGIASIIKAAQDAYAAQPQGFNPYSFRVVYAPTRIDNRLMSLYGTEESYLGAEQTNSTGVAVTYSLETGKVLTLGQLLRSESAAQEKLLEALLDALALVRDELELFSDYSDTVSRRFSATLQESDTWYLSADGLCFYFHPYDIASSAAGTIHITIPYEALTGVLQDAYFPDILPVTGGALTGIWFEDLDTSAFSYFTELIVDSDADFSALYTEKPVFNVVIESGKWNTEKNAFEPISTLFAAGSVIEKEAIVLQAKLSDTTPTLRLRYEVDGKSYSFFLMRDFRDGSVLLQNTD